MKMPKIKRGDFVEIRQGPMSVFRELQSYTPGGKRRKRPLKRESLKDFAYVDGPYYYRLNENLGLAIKAIWRKTSDDKMERIYKEVTFD